MRKIIINENPRDPMAEIAVGRASAFECLIVGVPANTEGVQIHFGTRDDLSVNAVDCRAIPGGEWKCYANGFFFPDVGKAHYHVTAKTAAGDSAYLGGGTLRIIHSVMTANTANAIIPEDTYIRNPKTGLWHKVVAELDEQGNIVLATEQEGITK